MNECPAPQPNRRAFIASAGIGLIALRCLPAIAANAKAASPRDLAIRSSPGLFSHTHDLLISGADLRNPPPLGVRIVSTMALFHTHDFLLTSAQLTAIQRGGSVTTTASSHTFVIALARGLSAR